MLQRQAQVTSRGTDRHIAHGADRASQRPVAVNRRQLGLGMLSGITAALHLSPTAAADLRAEGRDPTPYERGFMLEYGLTADGRVRACPSDVNPNCVSSASLNDCYSPAWESSQADVKLAIKDFEAALLEVSLGAELVESQSSPTSEYRRYRMGNALFDHDDVEVLIAEREDGEPPLVTYRSMAGTVRYIWPITLPISDFGAQRARMKDLRAKLGWRIPGCDLLECYLE